ncbi:hypothetical protein J2751_000516 [Halorubrum alkaliphilum]|uniref:DUF7344 domain-containing protein n=1 Tax=Halorubrum alkaliphilum TaxID=261290 RepID=A0A8T4GBP3_9EURY|nr:hypothetical protein [Halorubrum alkaliphilum]MBP1921523.1 hypothetical protein [Halorubrum alkaliphilum]
MNHTRTTDQRNEAANDDTVDETGESELSSESGSSPRSGPSLEPDPAADETGSERAPDESGRGNDSISTDELFALLSNGRRRHVLEFLSENGGEIKLRELATAIAAEENDLEPVEVNYTQRKRLYTSLYQSHLPRMERSGVIEYDRNSGMVTLGPKAEGFDAYLEVVGENEFTWSEFYLGLTGLFAAVTLAFATGTPPFASIGPVILMAALTLVLLVSSVAHVRYTRGRRL